MSAIGMLLNSLKFLARIKSKLIGHIYFTINKSLINSRLWLHCTRINIGLRKMLKNGLKGLNKQGKSNGSNLALILRIKSVLKNKSKYKIKILKKTDKIIRNLHLNNRIRKKEMLKKENCDLFMRLFLPIPR